MKKGKKKKILLNSFVQYSPFYYQKIDQQNKNLPHDKNCFWFRLSGLNIYYSSTKSDYNILGAVQIAEVLGVISLEGDHTGYHCFIVKDNYYN